MKAIFISVLFATGGPGGPLDSGDSPRNSGLGEMTLRIGLFMLGLLIFVFLCAYAWKTVPALRRILPAPKPEETKLEPAEPRLIIYTPKSSTSSPVTPPSVKKVTQDTKISSLLSDDPIGDAIADGRPGSVVRAASDLEGVETPAPIVFIRRED
jgi:hypothetical protein